MEITKTYRTETAHIVREAFSERCKYNVHGHSYLWEISFEGNIDNAGMVVDFGALKPIKQFIDIFDHAMVLWSNEKHEIKDFFMNNFRRVIIMKQNPTAENMSKMLMKQASILIEKMKQQNMINIDCNVKSVTVHETITGKATTRSYGANDTYEQVSNELLETLINIDSSLTEY